MLTSSHVVGATTIRRLYAQIKQQRIDKVNWLMELAQIRELNPVNNSPDSQELEIIGESLAERSSN